MIKNYIKVAWRNLLAYKGYTFINILGLSLGISVALLIALYVRHETNYDKWIPEKDQVYRVYRYWDELQANVVWTPSLLAQTLTEKFPEVVTATGLGPHAEMLLDYDGKKMYVDKVARVDSTFFEVLSLPFIHGDAKTALDDPNGLVISRSLAQRLFGKDNAVGEIIRYDNQDGFMINGVLDLGDRLTHLDYDLFTRFSWYSTSFTGNNRATYVKLAPGVQVAQLEGKITALLRELVEREYQSMNYTPNASDFAEWRLQPVSDVHLQSSEFGFLDGPGGNLRHIYIYLIIALLVLGVAIINYINLATSRAIQRKREVGVRKVTGALRSQLVVQFTTEAVLQSIMSLPLALAIASILLPAFNQITDRELVLFGPGNLPLLLGVTGLAVLVGVLAGYYPAVQVSSFQPVRALKEQMVGGRTKMPLRKFLVSGQFVVSIVLLAVMGIVYKQIQFMQHHDLQFSPDQVLVIPLNASQSHRTIKRLKTQIEQIQGVQSVATASRMPGVRFPDWGMLIEGQPNDVNPDVLFTDDGLDETLGIEVLEGRYLSDDIAGDTINNFVVNEQYVRQYGLDQPIGTRVKFTSDSVYGEIVGVVRDFHYRGLGSPIAPLVIGGLHNRWYAAIKLSTGDLKRTIAGIQELWKYVEPEHPMRYSFLDEDFNAQYMEQERFGKSMLYATLLTIFIAVLGLIGLTALTVQRRTKEIGIRKILGASVTGILEMMAREFILLVIIAFGVATPVAWYLGRLWLQDFAFRSPVPWWIFLAAGSTILTVVLLTVILQSFSAATSNPADALRNE